MRKAVLVLAFAALAVSCKKVPKGGNSGVLKMEEGVERYDTHETRAAHHESNDTMKAEHPTTISMDSVALKSETTVVADSAKTH